LVGAPPAEGFGFSAGVWVVAAVESRMHCGVEQFVSAATGSVGEVWSVEQDRGEEFDGAGFAAESSCHCHAMRWPLGPRLR
jgi:hypothetical protein